MVEIADDEPIDETWAEPPAFDGVVRLRHRHHHGRRATAGDVTAAPPS
jgi:hypothetical protein